MSGQLPDSSTNDKFFCVLCLVDKKKLSFGVKTELENHLREVHFKNSPRDEKFAIDLWMDRHIRYQESLNKCMNQSTKTIPDRNKTVYKGCPMCDAIIEVFSAHHCSPTSQFINLISVKQVFDIRTDPKGAEGHELLIKDLIKDYSGNNVNHINPHLRYYPYECITCNEEVEKARERGETDKEVVKTAVKAMMRRHIIDKHLRDTKLIKNALEEACEMAIKTLKVTELEKLTKKQADAPQVKISLKKPKLSSSAGPPRGQSLDVRSKMPLYLPVLPKAPSPASFPVNKIMPIPNQSINTPYASAVNVHPAGKSHPRYIIVRPSRFNEGVFHPALINTPIMTPMMKVAPKVEITTETSMNTSLNSSLDEPMNASVSTSMDTSMRTEIEEIQIDDSDDDTILDDTDVTTSEEEVSDSEINALKDKSVILGCVFCCKRYKTYEKALEHYLCHIKVFIECAKCDKLFTSIGDFRSHNPQHNENVNLKNVNQYKIARKWAENFLAYISKEKDKLADLTRDGTTLYCPVCAFAYSVYDITSNKKIVDPETIETHLYSHFNYFPYECMDCGYDDLKTEFLLDERARKHLSDKHNVSNAMSLNRKDLSAYFDKKNTIPFLDELIEKSMKLSDCYRTYNYMNYQFLTMYLEKQ